MKLLELKTKIKTNSLSDDFLIFVCKENFFIAKQYVEAISKNANKQINIINSIYDANITSLSKLLGNNSNINLLFTDTFEEKAIDYSVFKDVIVICEKIDKNLVPLLSDFIVEVNKLEDWQVKAYMKSICSVLDDEEINWLYKASYGDIYKIKNEIDKINLFYKQDQKDIINFLRFDKSTDLKEPNLKEHYSVLDFFTKNSFNLHKLFYTKEIYNYDPINLCNMLLKLFKNILLVTKTNLVSYDAIEISPQQYNHYRNEYSRYSLQKLLDNITFLSNIDLRLKKSELDLSKDKLIDYIVENVKI